MDKTPTRKVTAATLGTAVATIVLFLFPGDEPLAVVGAVSTVFTFVFGYLVKEVR